MFRVRYRLVREAMLDVVHLRLDVEQRLEGATGFVEDGASAVTQAVLREVADGERRGGDDVAGIGFWSPYGP